MKKLIIEAVVEEAYFSIPNRPLPLVPTYYSLDRNIYFPNGNLWGMTTDIDGSIIDEAPAIIHNEKDSDKDFVLDILATALYPQGRFQKP